MASICDVCPAKGLGEQWADTGIRNAKGHRYEVSTHGKLRNATTGRPMATRRNVVSGYVQATLGRAHNGCLVHRLVALAFLGPPPRDGRAWEVDHWDFDRGHNHIANLRWLPKLANAWRWNTREEDIDPAELAKLAEYDRLAAAAGYAI